MLIAALDPGKMRDSFGMVVIEPKDEIFYVRGARRWLGRDYTDVEREIAKSHLNNHYDHIVVEQNNVGLHVIEVLVRQYNLPVLAVTTSKDLKSKEKIMSAKVMDKNEMATYIRGLKLDHKIKFPIRRSKDMEELERQVSIFAEHRTESGKQFSYYAPGSEHDDLAMALMIGIHIGRYYIGNEENESKMGATSKEIDYDYDEDDILGSGVPLGATSKGRYVQYP